MIEGADFNKLILDTIDEHCKNEQVKNLIHSALRYELDIWNRHIRYPEIEDEYERIIEKSLKR